MPQLRLDRARDRHRRRACEAGEHSLADAVGQRREPAHAATSSSSPLRAPSRSVRWSPTRSAFAIAVSAGFTALDDGKKLVSTTYRLSRSCALQSTSSAEVCRVVAEAHGAALVGDARERDPGVADELVRDQGRVAAEVAEHALELRDQAAVALGVAVGVGDVDAALAVDRDAVVGMRQILGGEPEVDRVVRDVVEREVRERRGRAPASRRGSPRGRTCRASGCARAGSRSRRRRSRSR